MFVQHHPKQPRNIFETPRRSDVHTTQKTSHPLYLRYTANQQPRTNFKYSNLSALSSDHVPVFFKIQSTSAPLIPIQKVYNYRMARWRQFKETVNEKINLKTVTEHIKNINQNHQKVIDKLSDDLLTIIADARNISIPDVEYEPIRRFKLPPDILELKRARNNLRRRWNNFHDDVDKRNIKVLNKIISEKIQQLKFSRWEIFLQKINSEPAENHNKNFWRISNTLRKKQSTIIPPMSKTLTNENCTSTKLLIDSRNI